MDGSLRTPFTRTAAHAVHDRMLRQIPSCYGQIAYLGQLRNADTGQYEHHGLSSMFGEQETDAALRENHQVLFQRWLALTLAEKRRDLEDHLQALPDSRTKVLSAWRKREVYRTLVPDTAGRADRELFFSDLAILLELLSREDDGALAARSASRLR